MIALAIFVAAALALDSAMGANTRGTIRFEEKTLATWVASNKLVELHLYQRWPGVGRQDDESEFGGRKWFVETIVSEGPVDNTRRVDIAVGPAPDTFGDDRHPVSTLTALLARPPPESTPTTPATPTAPAGGS